ncbi:nuclear transport factor 2 family protein (plasmid) [Nocardioides sp. R1-1]|uniref:nuclear transport factor 2 family protein n=1 Tax=Nocardioides sp. R1-1 TaxID=3383502 RepID=UPI0038D0DDEB
MDLSETELAQVRRLLDVDAIQAVMLRYARAVDRADQQLMGSVFWPGGTDNHGMYDGDVAGLFERALRSRDDDGRARHHLLGIPQVLAWAGDRASVETYFFFVGAFGAGPNVNLGMIDEPTIGFSGGRYRDLFEKRDGIWKVLRRVTIYDWAEARPYEPAWNFFKIPVGVNRGAIEPLDATYESDW